MPEFALAQRLAEDCRVLGDLPLSRVLLCRDSRFPWLVLVPRRAGIVELIDLSAEERGLLMEEIAEASAVLRDLTSPDKLNVAALGNQVPQLHIHVVARRHGDAAWPGPIWGVGKAQPYGAEELDRFAAQLRQRFEIEERPDADQP